MDNQELLTLVSALSPYFVKCENCQKQNRDLERKIDSYAAELAAIKSQLKMITWILTATAAAVITGVAGLIFDLIGK